MGYIVTKSFCDAVDGGRFYRKGDTYPAEGVKPSKARINALLSGDNRAKAVFIRETAQDQGSEDIATHNE